MVITRSLYLTWAPISTGLWQTPTRKRSRSQQVPPPRQSYSPGGITIFALPAVPLCPL